MDILVKIILSTILLLPLTSNSSDSADNMESLIKMGEGNTSFPPSLLAKALEDVFRNFTNNDHVTVLSSTFKTSTDELYPEITPEDLESITNIREVSVYPKEKANFLSVWLREHRRYQLSFLADYKNETIVGICGHLASNHFNGKEIIIIGGYENEGCVLSNFQFHIALHNPADWQTRFAQ